LPELIKSFALRKCRWVRAGLITKSFVLLVFFEASCHHHAGESLTWLLVFSCQSLPQFLTVPEFPKGCADDKGF
jgi:hypothetical protein